MQNGQMQHRVNLFTLFIVSISLAMLSLTGCLKTRAQLRNQSQNEAAQSQDGSVPVQVTDVQSDQSQRAMVDELKNEITRLTGRLEDLERTNQELNQKTGTQAKSKEEENKKLETRIQELEATQLQMIEALKKKEKETPKVEPVDRFNLGKELFTKKKYTESIEAFSEYLKFPKGKNREDALYFRAEGYYASNQHKKAIIDYSEINEKFPKSKRMPKVLNKIGMSFEALGMKSDAKVFYQELVDKFPKSPEAKKAQSKIK
jgi:tol-pal system protein YbgF